MERRLFDSLPPPAACYSFPATGRAGARAWGNAGKRLTGKIEGH
jgi:hypothetical protein